MSSDSIVPTPAISARLAAALVTAAAVGAAALPGWRIGIGWPVCALAVLGVAAIACFEPDGGEASTSGAARRWPMPQAVGERWWRGLSAAAAIALILVSAGRAAPWLDASCLVTGVLVGSYSLAGGESWRSLARSGWTLPSGARHGLRWIATQIGARIGVAAGRTGRILGGVSVGVLLLAVFGWLFRSADPAFAELLHNLRIRISLGTLTRALAGFAVVGGCAASVAYIVVVRHQGTAQDAAADESPGTGSIDSLDSPKARGGGFAEWVIPLAMLDVLFAVFVFVQITVLFGGDRYVLTPGGPDYAVYARGGFLQLLTVTVLTLAVIGVLAARAGRETVTQRALLRGLGGALCALTIVVVVSALTRLGLYAKAYGFTEHRLLGYAAEVWLGLIFVGLLVAGVRLRASWLPRAIVASAVLVQCGLVMLNPDALMARTHMARVPSWPLDYAFLGTLSADAIDEIDKLPEPSRSCILRTVAADLAVPEPWYARNLSRQHARDLLARHPVAMDRQDCPPGSPFRLGD